MSHSASQNGIHPRQAKRSKNNTRMDYQVIANSRRVDIPNTENQDIEEESEDEGLKFGDLLSPGGQKFNFGSFEQHEIRKLWKMRIAENKSTAINEYGSNFFKSKFDPLAAIEAKAALLAQNSAEEVNSMKPSACEEMIMADRKELAPQAPSSPMGTQEAPEVEWSSQETTTLLTQDGAMEETNLQKATKNMECDKPIAGDKSEIEQPQQSPDGSMQEEDVGLATDLPDKATLQEEEISKKDPTNPQEVLADRRHSERLKNQGTGTLNMSEKAEALKEKKNLPELQQEEDKKSLEKGADVLEHGAALPLPARFSSRHWDGVAPVRMTLLKTTKTPPRWMTTPASSLGPSCSPDVTLLLFCFYDAVFRLS